MSYVKNILMYDFLKSIELILSRNLFKQSFAPQPSRRSITARLPAQAACRQGRDGP